MSDISVIGLGLMGSALASALVKAGHTVTVWNRSAGKIEPLVDAGAESALTLRDAVRASPVVLVCVSDYQLTEKLFSGEDLIDLLRGRTIIQLSTGMPRETVVAEKWFAEKGASYMDGAILGGPLVIGTEEGQILVCGKQKAWDSCRDVIRCLGGKLEYLGENIRAASTLDLAWLTQRYGVFVSVAHAINLCEAEGVSAGLFRKTVATGDAAKRVAGVIESDDFSRPTATLKVWKEALDHICTHATESHINQEFPDLVMKLLTRAEDAGYGEEDISALIKVLRSG